MKKIKKIVTIILAAALILGMTLTTSAANPRDPCLYCKSANVKIIATGQCKYGCGSLSRWDFKCNNCGKTYHYCINHGFYK